MEKGYNSDIHFQGQRYHVQTEDWGMNNPFVVTKVFCNGAVIKSLKTSYAELFLPFDGNDRQAIRAALQRQHQEVLDRLFSN